MAIARPPEIFVNEDVSKPENRLNLAMLALLNVATFRQWFLHRLGLPEDAVVYPPQHIRGNLRPDYVVTSPDRSVVHAWVEVELGTANAAQLAQYRTLEERIISIVGSGTAADDLTLEEVASSIRDLLPGFDAQAQVAGEMVITLVRAKVGAAGLTEYTDPDAQLRERPAIRALRDRLGDIIQFGTPPVPQGKLMITTITQSGWTLRVFARGAKDKSVSIMWDQSSGGPNLRVPSIDKLRQYLPDAGQTVGEYGSAIERLGVRMWPIKRAGSAAVPEQAVVDAIDDLAPIIRRLAQG